ncbi:uncharacterized protein LOC125561328 isoform X2 [Nematostella vectensis]|uniref:uncharacterized protein LOC125561328 isoform X2 n=1 Tax=Nematostella vectensis TaxID=45351 RepID=UPI0020779A70|nr:uncharacterized protein LOC125561328 isoform X2 [Nematostella vectensis]
MEIIIDGLRYVHEPLPPHITTFGQYTEHYYQHVVVDNGYTLGAKTVTIVFDTDRYLPPPRLIHHAERGSKLQQDASQYQHHVKGNFSDDELFPKGKSYEKMLTDNNTKQVFLSSLVKKLHEKAVTRLDNKKELITDFNSGTCSSISVTRCAITPAKERDNKQGEADYAILFYAAKSQRKNILIKASDTDVWIYGFAVAECGKLNGKTVYVERNSTDYVNVTEAPHIIAGHPKLDEITLPATVNVALYILSSNDYVSSIYGCSSKRILQAFLDNSGFICKEEPLVNLQN